MVIFEFDLCTKGTFAAKLFDTLPNEPHDDMYLDVM